MLRRALSVICAGIVLAAVAGCREEDPALAPACREGPDDVLRALRAAPADVRLDGDTPLSECLGNAEDGGQLADVGTGYVAAAQRLADRARRDPNGPGGRAARLPGWRRAPRHPARPGPGLRAGAAAGGRGHAGRSPLGRVQARAAGRRARWIASEEHRNPKGTHGRSAAVVGLGDEQGSRQLPGLGRAGTDPGGADARPREGRRRAHQRRAGPAGRRRGRADRRRRRRDCCRGARRPVPHRRVPDGVGHLLEHERQRGDRRAGGRRGTRQRPREHGPVLQRRVPVRGAPGGGRRGHREAAARPGEARAVVRRQGRPVGGRGQGRAHAHDGRGSRDAGPGVRRLRRAGAAWPRARVRRAAARAADPAWRHRHRHRPEHPRRVRREGARAAVREHRPGGRGARGSVRGTGQPRRAGGAVGRA